MQLEPELIAAVVAAAVFVAGIFFFRARTKRTRNVGRPVSGGPANLRYTCAGCSQQFTHSRRTLGAWDRGTRQFYCNACHTKWRGSHTAKVSQGDSSKSGGKVADGRRSPSRSTAGTPRHSASQSNRPRPGSGCLGMMVLFLAIPTSVVVVVVQYV